MAQPPYQQRNNYQESYHVNHSPNSTRGYGGGLLNRQPSQHFDNYTPSAQLYGVDDYASRHDGPSRYAMEQRMNSATLHSTYGSDYNNNNTWGGYGVGGANINGANILGGTGRAKPQNRGRPGIPQGWIEPQMPQSQSMNNYSYNNNNNNHGVAMSQNRSPPNDAGDLIPTAIVIKNIPFAVKKEYLVELMTEMNLPLPYAFNYHFDSGIFRGLAFANYTTAEETNAVINAMNHYDLQGRKLRVEFKKMLPVQERDRIEREKRERRGQLQEQHQPVASNDGSRSTLHAQSSMNSLSSNHHPTSPSPVSLRGIGGPRKTAEFDLNDPTQLGYYNELLLFQSSPERQDLTFPPSVPPQERRMIHTLAHHMGLEHRSEGTGEDRCVEISKSRNRHAVSPPAAQQLSHQPSLDYYTDSQRRSLNRAATIGDFSDTRAESSFNRHTLGRQRSELLDIPGSPGLGGMNHGNLRAAKSFADLRSYTPSPVPSTASFPAGLSQNVSRYTDFGQHSAASGTPNLTPTSAGGMNGRDESFLVNNLNNMTIGYGGRSNGGRIGQEREIHAQTAGPIGSQRPTNGNLYAENLRNGTTAAPERQPRGPEWNTASNGGFGRSRTNGHTNRSSGELNLVSIQNTWDNNAVQDSSDRNGAGTAQYM